MDWLTRLNPAQKEAVLHQDGPCLVLAGAGSGKTRVLTSRIARLIEGGVPHYGILAITFTNKAAGEMRERVNRMVPGFSGEWIQTFHAASYRILRRDISHLGYRSDFTILDDDDQKSLVKEILKENQRYETKPEEVLSVIHRAKNGLKDPERYAGKLNIPAHKIDIIVTAYRAYERRLKELNALDFEDLIGLTVRLFRECPEVLASYQDKFRFIMIDEYQDTNYAQYVWANLLAGKTRNLFVVGDPDQSIYSWRGAEPENIKRFMRDYPEARVIKLEQNYRSTAHILTAANAVILNNVDRQDKTLLTTRGEGEKLTEFCGLDARQEADFVARTVQELVRTGRYRYNDCAVFYRTHALSRTLEEALMRFSVPYHIVGALRFYQRREIKDVISYLKLIANPSDLVAVRRIINIPRRGVGEAGLSRLEELAQREGIPILEAIGRAEEAGGITRKAQAALTELYGLITYLASLSGQVPLADIIQSACEQSGYLEYLAKTEPLEYGDRLENIREFISLAREYEADGIRSLTDFLADIALMSEADDVNRAEAVLLMTFHTAKGLEFPVVFMTGMEEGIFPSYRVEDERQMEEERRLCYVGITRSQDKLFLTRAVNRFMNGVERQNPPSRFLSEIPENVFSRGSAAPPLRAPQVRVAREEKPPAMPAQAVALGEGDLVEHRKFGRGVVTKLLDTDIAIIDFGKEGKKTLKIDIAPLTLIKEGN